MEWENIIVLIAKIIAMVLVVRITVDEIITKQIMVSVSECLVVMSGIAT